MPKVAQNRGNQDLFSLIDFYPFFAKIFAMYRLEKMLQLKKLYQERASGRCYIEPFTHASPLGAEGGSHLPEGLLSLQGIIESCVLCELSKGEGKPIFGMCQTTSKVVFVSETPLVDPKHPSMFVGRSGEMLRNIVRNVLGLKEGEVSLLSLLKCHPSLAQKVDSALFSSCKPYILKQIDLLPLSAIIVPLGEVAYRYLTDERGDFSQYRGQKSVWAGRTLIPAHSLSYLLRNPTAKKEALKDFLLIKSCL